MKKVIIICTLILGIACNAQAIPTLQLDILGGTYDYGTETIIPDIIDGQSFTLRAILTPGDVDYSGRDFFISAAVIPSLALDEGGIYGTFSFDGSPIDVTSGMLWGTPPVDDDELLKDKDMSPHDVFDTYYKEFNIGGTGGAVSSDSSYNTQDRAQDGYISLEAFDSYYWDFSVNTAGLEYPYAIHFDFYTKKFVPKNNGSSVLNGVSGDWVIDEKAPFSHDAQSSPVPEPATMLLFGTGIAGLAGISRRKKAQK